MNRLITYFLIALFFGTSVVYAGDYCKQMPEPKKEGDTWYIPETAFTKEAANKALKNLIDQVNNGVEGRDFLVENELKMIKGYLYRAYLEEYKKEFGTEDQILINEFCKFIIEEAFITH